MGTIVHPFRSANREGFAAMGVAEVLLHTHDIAEGLGVPYEPAAELCEDVLARIFPHVRPGPDHWRTLLWATGRGELPGRAPVTEWRWSNHLVIGSERLTLQGVTPAAAADLRAGGTGGFAGRTGPCCRPPGRADPAPTDPGPAPFPSGTAPPNDAAAHGAPTYPLAQPRRFPLLGPRAAPDNASTAVFHVAVKSWIGGTR